MAKAFRSCAGVVGALSQCPHLAAAGLLAPLALLWMAPTLRVNAVGGAWGAEAALVTAGMALAAMVAIAAVLAAVDWLAENASRKAWAAIGVAPADLSAVSAVPEPEHGEDSYAPATNNKALWALLRAHRLAACPTSLGAAGKVSPQASLRTTTSQAKGTNEIPVPRDHMASGIAKDAIASDIALRASGTHDRKAAQSQASIRVAHQSKRRGHFGARAATRMRLVANSRPGCAWSDFDQPAVPRRLPIKIVSNIIVLGQGNQRSNDGERPLSAELNGNTSIAGSNGRQEPRARLRTFRPEISFDAKRQLIALAEALARQAAREDEAAERLAERSRSPPDAPAENSPGHDDKENASWVAPPHGDATPNCLE